MKVNSIFFIDKPVGWTSYDVIRYFKRKWPGVKIGHGGTLDPCATGMLPILLGEATKFSACFLQAKKVYVASIGLGKRTSTQDREGKIVFWHECRDEDLTRGRVLKVLNQWKGQIWQTPPLYSAIKYKGKRLYKYVRENEAIVLPIQKRKVTIYSIDLIGINRDMKEIWIRVSCSSGTYLRMLAQDIGNSMGCQGFLMSLRRVSVNGITHQDQLNSADLIMLKPEDLFLVRNK